MRPENEAFQVNPQDIESTSFNIIDHEAGPHDFSPAAWQIVRRMIHTTADFEWKEMIQMHPDAICAGIAAIRNSMPLVTDTHMARRGIRRRDLDRWNGAVYCYVDDAAVTETARREGITRSRAAMDKAVNLHGKDAVYVIGNAPTALLRLMDHMDAAPDFRPALVVGLPVGFVNAAESKALLMEKDVPFITNTGRKGGSTVAAAVVNALIILAGETVPSPVENLREELLKGERSGIANNFSFDQLIHNPSL